MNYDKKCERIIDALRFIQLLIYYWHRLFCKVHMTFDLWLHTTFLTNLPWHKWHSLVFCVYINSSHPGQNGHHFADDSFKCICMNEKGFVVSSRFQFHWSVFPRVQLTIRPHWFREWLVVGRATSHFLNQCWPSSLPHICGAGLGMSSFVQQIGSRMLEKPVSKIAQRHAFAVGGLIANLSNNQGHPLLAEISLTAIANQRLTLLVPIQHTSIQSDLYAICFIFSPPQSSFYTGKCTGKFNCVMLSRVLSNGKIRRMMTSYRIGLDFDFGQSWLEYAWFYWFCRGSYRENVNLNIPYTGTSDPGWLNNRHCCNAADHFRFTMDYDLVRVFRIDLQDEVETKVVCLFIVICWTSAIETHG